MQRDILAHLHRQLSAQIAVYFGREGGLATLQDGVHALAAGREVRCQECGQVLWNPVGYHLSTCRFVLEYLDAVPEPGG